MAPVVVSRRTLFAVHLLLTRHPQLAIDAVEVVAHHADAAVQLAANLFERQMPLLAQLQHPPFTSGEPNTVHWDDRSPRPRRRGHGSYQRRKLVATRSVS